jgi:hypothetical protein
MFGQGHKGGIADLGKILYVVAKRATVSFNGHQI